MEEYLNHHLRLTGLKENIFPAETVFSIHQSSGGILRRANFIAKAAMLAAVMNKQHRISPEHVRMASTELIQ
jgi:type II secretory pathway predicted ATPase ExeA